MNQRLFSGPYPSDRKEEYLGEGVLALSGERLQGSKGSQGGASPSGPLTGEADWFDGTLRGPPRKCLSIYLLIGKFTEAQRTSCSTPDPATVTPFVCTDKGISTKPREALGLKICSRLQSRPDVVMRQEWSWAKIAHMFAWRTFRMDIGSDSDNDNTFTWSGP
jgi:hypothetical protein